MVFFLSAGKGCRGGGGVVVSVLTTAGVGKSRAKAGQKRPLECWHGACIGAKNPLQVVCHKSQKVYCAVFPYNTVKDFLA